jgi:uncharacterized protein with FMN-binding domain
MRNVGTAVGSAAVGLAVVLAFHSAHSRTPLVVGPAAAPTTTVKHGAPTTTAPPPKGTTAPPATRTVAGDSENYGYGVLSVQVTLDGSRITDVTVTSLQAPESYSQSLAQYAVPMLRNEVLSAQSAQVNGISGATYTSEAYLYSVQSALDKAHA